MPFLEEPFGQHQHFRNLHTYTPEDQRHQGHADEVTRRAFEFAKNKGMKVWPTCPYVEGTFFGSTQGVKGDVCCAAGASEIDGQPASFV
ncbi:hypothetical protein BC829DRAFT_297268 [Chytridium lagenaria]|nr:hypothetical protein BC829DRAFT_297268 [Chytridium lagenaria]